MPDYIVKNTVMHFTLSDNTDHRLDCFLKDRDINRGIGKAIKIKTIKSASKCQEECRNDEECQSFVHVGDSSECFLKSVEIADATITLNEGLNIKAGPKFCGKLVSIFTLKILVCLFMFTTYERPRYAMNSRSFIFQNDGLSKIFYQAVFSHFKEIHGKSLQYL